MGLLAGLLVGWAVVSLAIGAYLVWRWATDGRQRVYLVLAGSAFAVAVYAAFSAVFHLADSPATKRR